MTIDPQAMVDSLRRLTGGGSGHQHADIVSALTEVVEACVDLFGVTGCGLMIADEQNITRYVTATDGPGRLLEKFESESGEGPCTEAFVENRMVWTQDLSTDDRWPNLRAAVAPEGVRAVLGVPIRMGAVTIGTLDVYRDHRHDWDETEKAAIGRFAAVIESVLGAALAAHTAGQLADQLQYALDHRVVVERGVGFLMARENVDAVTAFNRLRRTARSGRRKVGEVAEELLTTGRLGG